MSFKKLFAVAIILVLLIGTFAVGSYVAAQGKAKEKAYSGPTYEYSLTGMRLQPKWSEQNGKKVGSDTELEAMFNFQGAQGWEFVGTIPGKEDAIFLVFRRPKQ